MSPEPSSPEAPAGRQSRPRRSRKTKLAVRASERAARLCITVGGIGTIAAVTLIFAFLVAVVLPLFTDAEISAPETVSAEGAGEPLHFLVDEYGLLLAVLEADGTVRVRSLETGEEIDVSNPFEESGAPTAVSISPIGESLAFGFEDGSIRYGRFGFETRFPRDDELSEELLALEQGARALHGGGILEHTTQGQFRIQRFGLRLDPAFAPQVPAPVVGLAHVAGEDRSVTCAWTADGRLLFLRTTTSMDFLTGEEAVEVDETPLAYAPDASRGAPDRIFLAGIGDNVLLLWRDGRLERLDVRDPKDCVVAEVCDLVPEDGEELTAATPLIGSSTLVTGASNGRIRAWFRTKPEVVDTQDGILFVAGHELATEGPAVTTLAPSPRRRMVAAGSEDGTVRLYHVTTQQELAETRATDVGRVQALRLMPKEDGLVAFAEAGVLRWDLEANYPEASLGAFFAPVWYESHPEPQHVWQSESATDDFEPKFGFMPLVYGTLKATFFSMIFGAPLALLAAIFTSEFLDRRLRVPVKSTIEMMASLPSVVLGFLAGIVIAPFAQKILPATLAVFVTMPLVLLAGAYLWQLLPSKRAIRWSGWPRLLCIFAALSGGAGAALLVGPWLETAFFAGNIELWLDGQRGTATGGWMLLLLPLSALVVALGNGRVLGPWIRALSADWSRTRTAVTDLARFAAGVLLTAALALVVAYLLDAAGFDPRGTFVDTYVQRNALVVGFVMGFAVIPIIYTLSEDALSSVPEHLRQASLGAGATPWQTAVRVIVPTAMSGLFSAVMIGLGRAVGETMIVLMATGNTPVMEMNIFSGFRTLSANIAVELPEAVQNSTHYRTLFLAALVLFAMTFVLNTVAEAVRQRFRKRAYQL